LNERAGIGQITTHSRYKIDCLIHNSRAYEINSWRAVVPQAENGVLDLIFVSTVAVTRVTSLTRHGSVDVLSEDLWKASKQQTGRLSGKIKHSTILLLRTTSIGGLLSHDFIGPAQGPYRRVWGSKRMNIRMIR